ncbi:MAG: DUF7507 domain-containing protein [Candidatus Limnocylindrales bacterium]
MSRGLWFAMSARTRRSLTVLWTALFLCSLALQYVQMAAPAPALAAHNEGIFELDGNALDSGSAGADWENGAEGSLDQFFVGMGSEGPDNDDTYFTTGGSKDENNISSWKITTNSVPDKNELLNAYAAVYEQGGDTWVYFGADRFDNDGDAQIGFWFFQNNIGTSGADFTGTHKVGDVLILSEYTNGGAVDLVCAYEWNPPGGNNIAAGGDCDDATNGSNLDLVAAGAACDVPDGEGTYDICAVTNEDTSDAPWPFLNKDASADFGVGQFFEGGINLSDMFGGQPPCFGTFLAETRSSQETDAQLKDFALGSLDTCVPPDIETHVQQSGQNVSKINKGESVVDVATFDGTNGTVTGTAEFFVCGPNANAKPDCSTGGTSIGTKTIANETATSDAFTPTQLGWYCFRVKYTPDAASQYRPGSHTNDTTECFRVIPADVQIVKTPNDGSANAGETISFTLSWTNEGEGAATGVVVTDPLPTGNGLDWSITGSTGTGSTCQITAGDSVTCTIGTIAGNPNFPAAAPVNGTVTLSSGTTAASCGAINNTGQITSSNDGTDTDPGKITVLCPDVNVVKTPNDGQVNAGDPASFSIKVTNAGPGTATGVTLSDPLPAGLSWALGTITGDTTGVTCAVTGAAGSQTLNCADTSMTAGQSFTVTVTTTTSSAQCATFPNVATVDATNESNDASVTDDNTDPGAITVNCPDVQALKVADKSPVNAGDQIGFTVTIKNNGTGTAYGATGTDTLPSGIAWSIDGAANGWSIVAGVLTFGPADLAPGASATVHVVGTTDAADCGVVPNTVTVDATNESNAPALTDDNSASAEVTVNCPDVQALKSAIKSPVNAGDQIGFTITIKNNGTGTAYGATGSDTLPSGIDWSIDGAANGWSIVNGVLTFGPADLAPGASASVTIVGITDAADCGVVPNTVTVDATNESNALDIVDDNSASANVTVECPDLDVDKVADDGTISAGEVAAFSIVITNIGDGTAYDVSLTDTLPSGVAWNVDEVAFDGVPVADPDALCTITGVTLSCPDLGSLAPDAEISIAVSGDTDLDDCGTLLNSVVVDATNESNAASIVLNNSAMATVVVDCPLLAIDKDADHVDPVIIGGQIGFTITIKNNGAGTAFGVTVADTLDPDFTWSIATPSTGWSLVGNALSFSGNLAAGASSSVHVIAPTTIGDADQCGLVPNTAVLDHSSIDPTPASASEAVRCPDTDITKIADDDFVEPNQTVTYTINVKVVDGPVTDAVVTDTLPVGQTYVTGSATPAPASVSPDGRTITWTYASLATGDPAATITYDVTIDANATGAAQQNRAELCVAEEAVDCVAAIEIVTPQRPTILLVKTAGTAADGAVFETEPGPVTYTYKVTNTGPLTLFNVTVTDDAGTPGTPGDDFTATCPKTTLAPAESMTCTFTKTVLVDTTNIAVARGVTAEGNPAQDDDDAKVVTLEYSLLIDKSNDAPLETLELPDGSTTDLPTADEGDTVTYTLVYTFAGDPVTNAIITDVLPVGVTYVAGSASNDDQFTFQTYNAATRTLTWTAPGVNKSGSVTYQAKVDVGASELPQPLINVAAIDSDQTPRDDDDSPVFVPTIPLAATGTPRVTLPPTDILDTPQSSTSNVGFSLMLALLALAAVVLVIGFVTPVPASVRERPRR